MQSPKVSCGRRSKKPLGVIIQKLPNGFDDVNGYFPPSDDEFDNDADILEEMEEPSTQYVMSDSAKETPSLISEDELCIEERLLPGDDELADIESRLTSNDELDRSSGRRSSKNRPGKRTKSLTADGSPRHVPSVVEYASDAASGEYIATPDVVTKQRRSGTGVALGSSSSKVQRTPASPFIKSGIGQKHSQEPRVERRSESKDRSFVTAYKTVSMKKATPQRRKTPEVNKAHGSEKRQRNESSQQNSTVNTSVSKDISSAKSLRRDLEPGKQRKIKRKKSMRSTAVSTDDLVHFDHHVDDGENCENDMRNETRMDESKYQVGNEKFPTRYIIIEERPGLRKVVGSYSGVGTGSLRESKFRRQEPRYYSSRKKRPVDLRRGYLSTSGDERPNERVKASSRGNKGEPSQGRKRSRRQLPRKSEGMSSVHRKIPSSTPLYHHNVDESLNSGRFNRLENKTLARKSSIEPTELPEDFPVDENKEELVNDNVAKPQVKKKVRRKRIQRVTYPTRKKKIKVEKIDEDYECKEEFENNGNEADAEATQHHVHERASTEFQNLEYLVETPKSRLSSVILSGGESKWIGPSPLPIGPSSSHRMSAEHHPAADEVEKVKGKQRRKGTRLCYPAGQKKNLQKKAKYSDIADDEKVERSERVSQIENEHKIKERGKMSTNDFEEKLYADVSPTMLARDNEDRLMSMDLVFTPAMLRLAAPGRLSDGRVYTDFSFHKFFEHPLFNAGRLALLPMAEKGHQFVQKDTLLFQVISGEIDFIMENIKKRLGSGCTFFVPCGNAYNIKNTRREEAMIFFVQIKG